MLKSHQYFCLMIFAQNKIKKNVNSPISRFPSGDPRVSWLPDPGEHAVPDVVADPGEMPGKPLPADHKCAVAGQAKLL